MDQAAITLSDWVAEHGPLWPDAALVVALDVCARASRMTDPELEAVVGSLNAGRIVRGSSGGWTWTPARAATSATGTTDADVIERLGALLFHAMTGREVAAALADESTAQTRLRNLRPDLSPAVADLIVRALSTRQSRPWPLHVFARDAGRVLSGVAPVDRRSRRGLVLTAAAAALVLAVGTWWNARAAQHVESHGLTASETVLVDVVGEAAQGLALMDEHTAALGEYQRIARWWSARVPPEDPRLAWNTAHEAWVRTLRGDRLTTEQILGTVEGATAGIGGVVGTTARLQATLGDRHPYTRAARLELAATLDARGARTEAAKLRAQVESGMRELLDDQNVLLSGIPAAPGVVAHLAPNAPEREGFRRGAQGGYFTPLTSIQRLMSSRGGWRLHVIAVDACRTSVVVEDPPRQIVVNASRGADHKWQVQIDGARPVLVITSSAAEKIRLTLIGDGRGAVRATVAGQEEKPGVLDAATAPPAPPHRLAFDGGPAGTGCALVWLEIPFPFAPVPAP